jgi:hypothetical protein
MPLEGEEKKKWQAEYDARRRQQRAENTVEKDEIAKAAERDTDAIGLRHRSETKSYSDLAKWYFGLVEDPEVEDADDKKKKKKKKKALKPATATILGEKRTFGEWLALRDKARKDLFWLGKDVLKRDFIPFTHQIICDQFVQKNFDGVFKEGYSLKDVHKAIDAQTREKEMILLDPRGFYKSTIDGVDSVQWIINAPDIRILIITGEYKLALAFMSEIKRYFYLADGGEATDFHYLFPDFVLSGIDGRSKEPIQCPARKHNQVAPTLWINSIDANLSGWHCDIKKGDDVVTDENSKNETARKNLKEKYDGTANLLDEWGFSDHIGTRYYTDDWYGTKMLPVMDDNDIVQDTSLRYFCRACWQVKPGFEQVPLRQLTEDMVILNFPEKASFKSLRKKLLDNERSFRNQQLNEPTDVLDEAAFKITFEKEVLIKHSYAASAAPKIGDIYIGWDWAYTDGKYSDMSAGAAGRVYKREDGEWGIAVLEVIYGRWKPSELAFHIVQFNKKWNPKKTLIEKTMCADLLKLEVQRQAMKYGVTLDVFWKPVDLSPDAKRNRIKGLEVLLTNGLLWFVTGAWLEETFLQLVRYTGERKGRGRKDDLPDAISFLAVFCPRPHLTRIWKQC